MIFDTQNHIHKNKSDNEFAKEDSSGDVQEVASFGGVTVIVVTWAEFGDTWV